MLICVVAVVLDLRSVFGTCLARSFLVIGNEHSKGGDICYCNTLRFELRKFHLHLGTRQAKAKL